MLYVCNVDEASAAAGNAYLAGRSRSGAQAEGAGCVVISAKIEAEIAGLPPEERAEFLDDLGLEEAGLNRLIREGYALLGLHHLLHRRPEGGARLDRSPRGTKAPQAAGVIHTDFEKGFIRAETIAYDDFVALGGEAGRQGSRQDAPRRQGVRRQGRRRDALPLRELSEPPACDCGQIPRLGFPVPRSRCAFAGGLPHLIPQA